MTEGVYTWASGAKYIGKFEKRMKSGSATMHLNGLTINGYWVGDRLHGKATVMEVGGVS